MSVVTVPALILRGFAYGDTSRILRLLTPEHGVVGAIARGARRPRSRFSALLDPFGDGVAVLLLRDGRDLQTLTAFDLTTSRRGLGRDLRRYGAASLVAELLMRTATTAASQELYARAIDGLDRLDRVAPEDVEAAGLGTAWSLVEHLGFGPELDACTRCGRPLDPAEEAVFDYGAGGVRCSRCGAVEGGARLPAPARADLSRLVAGCAPRLERTYGHWVLLERFLAFHVLDRAPLRSLAFLLDVRRSEAAP